MGCLSYKFWSLVAGWLSIVAIAIVGGIIGFSDFLLKEHKCLDEFLDYEYIKYIGLYIIPVLVLDFIATILLITGVHKHRRNLMVPFICLNVVFVLCVLTLIGYVIYMDYSYNFPTSAVELWWVVSVGLGLLLIFPVWKFYKQLGQAIIIQPTNDAVLQPPVILKGTYNVHASAALKV